MNIKYLLVLALVGCASNTETKPLATKQEPPYVRHMTSKTNLLYTYTLRGDGATGYELAEADAEKVCRSKWNLGAIESVRPSCGTYNAGQIACAVTFRCQ